MRHRAHRNLGDVAEANDAVFSGAQGDIAHRGHRGEGVVADRQIEQIIVFEPANGSHRVGLGDRFRDIGERQPIGPQLLRADDHLDLGRLAAEHADPADAGNAGEQRRNLVLGEAAQLGRRHFVRDQRIGDERHDHVRAHLNDLVARPLRQIGKLLRERRVDAQQRLLHVRAPGEIDKDLRRAARCRRGHPDGSRDRARHLLQRFGRIDQHLPGRHAAGADFDPDARKAGNREQTHRQGDTGEQTGQRQGKGDEQQGSAMGFDPPDQVHFPALPSGSATRTFMPFSSW